MDEPRIDNELERIAQLPLDQRAAELEVIEQGLRASLDDAPKA
ncbi:MAG: hypothetical protein WDA27_00510 [Actinomycetota bacterium]